MRILLIGDIHIGSIKDTQYVYNVMTNIIDKEIIFNKTDLVCILGDYFDRLFKANEEYISLSINIMSYLVDACISRNVKIRYVYGTESHDNNQYRLFNYFFKMKNLDIKLFKTVSEEVINGKHILYIPEEYMFDKHKFYKKYLYSDKTYDYIFGHGVIVEAFPTAVQVSTSASNGKEKSVPRFKSGELGRVCKLCVFNHFHVYTQMDNVYYLGSLFRNSFGEEKPKGYGIIEDDKLIFVENKRAYIYKTYTFDENSSIYNSNDNIIKEINKIKSENKEIFTNHTFGKIRLKLKIPMNVYSSFKDDLISIINEDRVFSVIFEDTNDIVTEEDETSNDEYDFLLDNNIQIHEKIHSYINKQYNYDLSINQIKKYITEPLNY